MRTTGSGASAASSSETVSTTGAVAVGLLSSSVATASSTDTVSTTGALGILLLSPSVATGSGGTGGGTGGMIAGGTIEGLEQIELIVRPNENPKEESQWREAHYHPHPRGQYEANEQRLEW